MVAALQKEGESITKLEKADVLELTVRHLRKLRRQEMLTLNPQSEQENYRAGYTACATEISQCLTRVAPSVDLTTRTRLMSHLGHKLALAPVRGPPVLQFHLKPSPPLPQEADLGYNSGRDSTPSPSPPTTTSSQETVWRPF